MEVNTVTQKAIWLQLTFLTIIARKKRRTEERERMSSVLMFEFS